MNEEELTHAVGEHLRDGAEENALVHLELMRFMTQNAPPELWGKADQAGLKPGPGQWVVFMNQRRTKPAATKAEAEEIARLVHVIYGDDSEAILEWLRHAVFDPLWALHNLNHLARFYGLLAEI